MNAEQQENQPLPENKKTPATPLRVEAILYRREKRLWNYALALFYSLGGIFVLRQVHAWFPENEPPLILLALAVTASAWQGGFGPGFVSSFIVTFGSWGFLIPPPGFAAPHPVEIVRLILIEVAGASVSLLAERMHMTLDQLRRNERRVRIVLESAALGIAEFNADDRIILANRHLHTLLGYPPDSLLGKSLSDLVPSHELPACLAIQQQLRNGRIDSGDYETRYRPSLGNPIAVHVTVAAVRDAAGRFHGSIGTVENITERKLYAEERERLVSRLAQDVQDIKSAEEDLARSNRDLEQFANVVSHDLKEPLRMVEAFGGLLQERHAARLEGEAREYLEFMIDGIRRMSALIQGLLDYSRVDRGAFVAGETDMNEVLAGVLRNLRLVIEATGTSIHAAPLPTLRGNPTQLIQLLQNLVENAIKYRRRDAPCLIEVRVERREHDWLFTVQDNGQGIALEHHEKIFELFHRLQVDAPESGIGLGLAVCKKIVERHGGRIWVESDPGSGSRFMFTLPVR